MQINLNWDLQLGNRFVCQLHPRAELESDETTLSDSIGSRAIMFLKNEGSNLLGSSDRIYRHARDYSDRFHYHVRLGGRSNEHQTWCLRFGCPLTFLDRWYPATSLSIGYIVLWSCFLAFQVEIICIKQTEQSLNYFQMHSTCARGSASSRVFASA